MNFGPATLCVVEFLLIVDFFRRMLFTTLLKRSFSISVNPRFLGPPNKGGTGLIHPPLCEDESSSSEDSGGVKGAEAEVLLLQGAGADVEV